MANSSSARAWKRKQPGPSVQAYVEGCEVAGEATRALQCHEAWKGECSPGLVSRGHPRDQREVDSVACDGPAGIESDADGIQYCLHPSH